MSKHVEEVRLQLDPESSGTCKVETMVQFLAKHLEECLDTNTLTEAFDLFDADHDGRINLEEFEFFMNGFAKDMNKLRDNKIVQQMLAEVESHADAEKTFEIAKLVSILKDAWKTS